MDETANTLRFLLLKGIEQSSAFQLSAAGKASFSFRYNFVAEHYNGAFCREFSVNRLTKNEGVIMFSSMHYN